MITCSVLPLLWFSGAEIGAYICFLQRVCAAGGSVCVCVCEGSAGGRIAPHPWHKCPVTITSTTTCTALWHAAS